MTNKKDPEVCDGKRNDIKKFFSIWFYISIVLILIGLIVADVESSHSSHQYVYHLISGLFQSIGLAVLVANIFSFVIGTEDFLQYIRQRLINIVISKEFVTKLDATEQRSLLHMVLKPAKELSSVYSGISEYFNNYIDQSLELFDNCYRGHMVIDAVASFNEEDKRVQIEIDLDYIVYKISESFEPIKLGLEDKDSKHIKTTIRGAGNLIKELTDSDAVDIKVEDPTMEQMAQLNIPDEFNTLNQINISRKIIEKGNDHWQVFSYKTIKACDQLTITLRCQDGLVIRNCSTYGVQDRYSIEREDCKIKVAYNDWLSPGFGVNIMVAKKDHH